MYIYKRIGINEKNKKIKKKKKDDTMQAEIKRVDRWIRDKKKWK